MAMVLSARSQKLLTHCKEAFWITIGLALYGCAWNVFILPQGFVGGGFGGICAMIYYITGIPVSISYLLSNVVLCTIAFLIMGKEFSIKTVFGILGLTLFLSVIPIPETPLIMDKLLSGIMGGIIAGTGVATYLLHGASTGGSDIIVMIVSKYKNVSWGKVYLIFDACVIASSFFLPTGSIEIVAYGFVFMGVQAYTIDMVSNGRRQSVQMFIFTSKYREVADQIIHQHHRGATLFESIGWYTKQHRKTIYLVVRKREAQPIFKTVKAIDPKAFIAVSNVMSVFGMGFDAIKAGFTKPVLKNENGEVIENQPITAQVNENEPKEGAVDSEMMKDEAAALERIRDGREAQYDPHWETPASELMEIPEMPIIPEGMVEYSVQEYVSVTDMQAAPKS